MDDINLNKCPNCGGPADNGHDRCYPPNPYYCTKCQDNYHPEPAAPEPLGDSEGTATQVVAGLEPAWWLDRAHWGMTCYKENKFDICEPLYSAATVERLQAELAAAQESATYGWKNCDILEKAYQEERAKRDKLQAENEALRKDAERWRFFRIADWADWNAVFRVDHDGLSLPDLLDKATDAAMKG